MVVLAHPPFWLEMVMMGITQVSYLTQLLKCLAQQIELSTHLSKPKSQASVKVYSIFYLI